MTVRYYLVEGRCLAVGATTRRAVYVVVQQDTSVGLVADPVSVVVSLVRVVTGCHRVRVDGVQAVVRVRKARDCLVVCSHNASSLSIARRLLDKKPSISVPATSMTIHNTLNYIILCFDSHCGLNGYMSRRKEISARDCSIAFPLPPINDLQQATLNYSQVLCIMSTGSHY
jgi:hypothetical protein